MGTEENKHWRAALRAWCPQREGGREAKQGPQEGEGVGGEWGGPR